MNCIYCKPDILCLGKALTGGTMTLAATVASEAVARGIEEAGPEQGGGVFMHGPTFMGNPLACAVGCASLDLLNASPWAERVEGIRRGLEEGLSPCREFRGVRDVRTLGAIGVVEVDKPVNTACAAGWRGKCPVRRRRHHISHHAYHAPRHVPRGQHKPVVQSGRHSWVMPPAR